jgi:hypothetical protein
MERDFDLDFRWLKQLAFKRFTKCQPLMDRFRTNESAINKHPNSIQVWQIYEWLLAPYSLWPIDLEGLATHLVDSIERKIKFKRDLILLLDLVGCSPDKETQKVVAAFEHLVEAGSYDQLLKKPEKFKEIEAEIKRDNELKSAWEKIKANWDITEFQNSRGVIRRRMSQERNFRANWDFDWKDSKRKFYLFFDALCYRWKLYGMEKDEPLLLKISANPTPHGTMIVIPRHWSLDLTRDLHWSKIGELHRAHMAIRRGPKMSPSRILRKEEAHQAKKYWDEAKAKGFRGDARYDFVLKKMSKDLRTDHSWVNRLLRLAKTAKTTSFPKA